MFWKSDSQVTRGAADPLKYNINDNTKSQSYITQASTSQKHKQLNPDQQFTTKGMRPKCRQTWKGIIC